MRDKDQVNEIPSKSEMLNSIKKIMGESFYYVERTAESPNQDVAFFDEEAAERIFECLSKQIGKKILKEFVEWLKDRFDSRIDMARDQYFYALNHLHNTLDCCLWSREQNVLQRTHDFLDKDLECFLKESEV